MALRQGKVGPRLGQLGSRHGIVQPDQRVAALDGLAFLELDGLDAARDLGPQGIRVNLVSAGPLRTLAARSIPGFDEFEAAWGDRAPLGWDVRDPEPTARACVALLSNWFPATTGEIVHVDGGFHAIAVGTGGSSASASPAPVAEVER